jgi:hypothetical protein
VKADVKFPLVQRIIYLVSVPSRFLFGCIAFIWASRLKPHPLALKEFGIRVVAIENYGTWDNHDEVYAALALLNRFDPGMMELVKTHIRTILLPPVKTDLGHRSYFGIGRICFVNLQTAKCRAERLPIAIAGGLVYFASLTKLTGKFGVYLRTNEEVSRICKEEQRRTIRKLSEIPCE